MELNEYQQKAMSTCMESCENDAYMMLNLVAEVGEFAGKMAKHIRRGEAVMANDDFLFSKRIEYQKQMNNKIKKQIDQNGCVNLYFMEDASMRGNTVLG